MGDDPRPRPPAELAGHLSNPERYTPSDASEIMTPHTGRLVQPTGRWPLLHALRLALPVFWLLRHRSSTIVYLMICHSNQGGHVARSRSISLAERVTQLLGDAADPEVTGLFLELWIMARRHGFGAEVVNRFYEKWAHAIAEAISHEYPDRSQQELLRVAYFLMTLADGVCAVFSRLGDRSVEHDEIIPLAIEAIEGLLGRGQDGA